MLFNYHPTDFASLLLHVASINDIVNHAQLNQVDPGLT